MSSTPRTFPAGLSPESLEALARAALHDRIVGTIVGSALGDAIGLYTEFLSAAASAREYPSRTFVLHPVATPFCRDFHRSPHLSGEWTDDTDHALLILLSFLHANGQILDPKDFAARLRVWVLMGLRALDTMPLGLGRTVGSVVRSKEFLEKPHETAYETWVKGGRNLASNGSLMRTHPLGLACLSRSLDETFDVAAGFSVMTHVDSRCVVACMIGTALVRGLIRGEVREEKDVDGLIETSIAAYDAVIAKLRIDGPGTDEDPPLDIAELKKHTVEPQTIASLELDTGGIGYVYKTLGSGILLLRLAMRDMAKSNDGLATQLTVFEPLITSLIMEGGDSDTNACFAGALLGAYLGHKALPPQWRDGLRHGQWLVGKAEALSRLLGVAEGTYDGTEDKDTHPDGGRGFITVDGMEKRWMILQARVAQENRAFIEAEEREAKKRKGAAKWTLPWQGKPKN
jgi:ADP-ribosylglycohydrolase